jgi:uncharacterized membrane protein YraQ (UPF0718 family)
MFESLFWSVFVRTAQLTVEASTTLLCGLLVAGVMRRMLGAEGVRRLFGGSGWKGLFRAWAVGTVLPVCSLGVIPIAREMRRADVPTGTLLAFVLAAPHINPLSLLYGLTLSEPLVIVSFALGSLVIALFAGIIWDGWLQSEKDAVADADEPAPAPGWRRLAAVVVAASREAVGPSAAYILIGLLFTGLLAGALPRGCLGTTMRHTDWTSPLLMTALALFAYSGPLPGMMRLGLMFEHGNSVGAAFVLFELGIGMNLGLAVWSARCFGWRRTAQWLACVTAATIALAYAAEQPLYFAHAEEPHTHAFDAWSSPFELGATPEWSAIREQVLQKLEVLEPLAMLGLLVLLLLGGLLHVFDPSGRVDAYLCRQPVPRQAPRSMWNRDVPGPVLGLVALGGLIVFSGVALYLYYPSPRDAFTDIGRVRADALVAVRTGRVDEAVRQIGQWDLLTRKLQVGILIRTGRMDPEVNQLADDLRECLEKVRDALLAGHRDEAVGLLPKVEAAYLKCRNACLSGSAGSNG